MFTVSFTASGVTFSFQVQGRSLDILQTYCKKVNLNMDDVLKKIVLKHTFEFLGTKPDLLISGLPESLEETPHD